MLSTLFFIKVRAGGIALFPAVLRLVHGQRCESTGQKKA